MLSAICGECNMPPSGCSLGPLWFYGQPTQRLDVSCNTQIIITRFHEPFLMPVLDVLKAFWILGVFLLTFFWLPTHLFSGRPNSPRVLRIAGNWARTVLCVTILIFLMCSLRVFGDHGCFVFFGRDSHRLVSQARRGVARFVDEPASNHDKHNA